MAAVSGRLRKWRDDLREPALTAMLITQAAVIVIAAPSAAVGFRDLSVEWELLRILTASLIVVISRGQIVTTAAVVAVAMIASGNTWGFVAPSLFTMQLTHFGTIIGSVIVGVVVGRAVLAPGAITVQRVLGAIVLYLNFGMIAAAVYRVHLGFVSRRIWRGPFRYDSGTGGRHPDLFQFCDADDDRVWRYLPRQCLCQGGDQSGGNYRSTLSGDVARAVRLARAGGAPPMIPERADRPDYKRPSDNLIFAFAIREIDEQEHVTHSTSNLRVCLNFTLFWTAGASRCGGWSRCGRSTREVYCALDLCGTFIPRSRIHRIGCRSPARSLEDPFCDRRPDRKQARRSVASAPLMPV